MRKPYLYRECSKGVPQGTPQLLESKHAKSAVLPLQKVWVKKQVRSGSNPKEYDPLAIRAVAPLRMQTVRPRL
jgi:hypothetical protein